jgi:hypothetical protein
MCGVFSLTAADFGEKFSRIDETAFHRTLLSRLAFAERIDYQ